MNVRRPIAFAGFSAFERSALASAFRLALHRPQGYRQAESLADGDFVVADADCPAVVDELAAAGLLGRTVFVGAQAPRGAASWMMRPIDPLQVLRELDALVAHRDAPPGSTSIGPFSLPLGGGARHAPQRTVPGALEARMRRSGDITVPPTPAEMRSREQRAAAAAAATASTDKPASASPSQSQSKPPPAPPNTTPTPAARVAARSSASSAVAAAAGTEPMADAPSQTPLTITSVRPRRAQRVGAGALEPESREALLVDDSDIALCLLELKLKRLGLRTRLASSSQQALREIERAAPDLVFVDLDLGPHSDLDGLGLCRRLRGHLAPGERGGPMLIMVSAYHSEADRVRGTLAGCDAYLGKPLEDDAIRRALSIQSGVAAAALSSAGAAEASSA